MTEVNPYRDEYVRPDAEILEGLEKELESLDQRRAWILQLIENYTARGSDRLFDG